MSDERCSAETSAQLREALAQLAEALNDIEISAYSAAKWRIEKAIGLLGDAQTECMTKETGWLIEWPGHNVYPVRWWHPEHGWTSEANKALRFARKCDGEDYSKEKRLGWIKVTEHMFIGDEQSPAPPQPAQAPAVTNDVREALISFCPDDRLMLDIRHFLHSRHQGLEAALEQANEKAYAALAMLDQPQTPAVTKEGGK